MKHVSIQSNAELLQNLNDYEKMHTKGREPDKDYIYDGYINRILQEMAARDAAKRIFSSVKPSGNN